MQRGLAAWQWTNVVDITCMCCKLYFVHLGHVTAYLVQELSYLTRVRCECASKVVYAMSQKSALMDEADLLESIFAELDGETLGLLAGEKASKKDKDRINASKKSLSASKISINNDINNTVANRTPRKPLQAIACNSQPRTVHRSAITKDKPRKPCSCALSQLAVGKPVHGLQVKNGGLDDSALLEGIEWSDDEGVAAGSSKQAAAHSSCGRVRPEATALARERAKADYVPISRRFTRCLVKSVSEKTLHNFRREKVEHGGITFVFVRLMSH